ncbi:MAG TPA: N-acetylmuramoyl-L-alanine amidase [Flavobacteriales bacterium]|nr:N-acetylmuramoyl-L-alanine amidase [Flavobacteriales bacterium]HCA83713.1 N-acetylmuramoyl-L-alanine amidase [Flavobacteriales bacterium]HRE75548.1 N-acetylmuramoyl-L-alanine amidase [Flavobacteriales bacterium]HRE98652.1 N-acetylmuramoyl-L-alanine amidase [Flavobacteriales bacterium]HRJ35038.1 N-acetylmuramoyl-L-alanine amidase [Flavobacteriales bacterium]
MKRLLSMRLNERKRKVFLVLLLVFFQSASLFAAKDTLGIRTVVIDPGHGGKDPGCLGKFSHEADVALAISLKLGKMIKTYYGDDVKVIYTRTEDKFVELAERARIANKVNADLFICIHANASANTGSKGTETYVLGLHKADAQLKVAERENNVILVEDNYETKYQNFNPKDPDSYIYLTMVASAFRTQSNRFAEHIQKYVAGTPNVTDRGVKQAGFLVLHQVNMPSVLVETGFLTNPEEEKILNNEQDQFNIAKAIFKAFVDYKSEVDLRNGLPQKDRGNPDEVITGKKNGQILKTDSVVIKDNKTNNPPDNSLDKTPEIKSPFMGSSQAPVSALPYSEEKVVFKVQIRTSSKEIGKDPANFYGLQGVEYYKADNLYKYTYGKSNNFDEAKKWESEAREKGFKEAFVVAFLNGERIDINVARGMANK